MHTLLVRLQVFYMFLIEVKYRVLKNVNLILIIWRAGEAASDRMYKHRQVCWEIMTRHHCYWHLTAWSKQRIVSHFNIYMIRTWSRSSKYATLMKRSKNNQNILYLSVLGLVFVLAPTIRSCLFHFSNYLLNIHCTLCKILRKSWSSVQGDLHSKHLSSYTWWELGFYLQSGELQSLALIYNIKTQENSRLSPLVYYWNHPIGRQFLWLRLHKLHHFL